jgi:negative regulator of flagellin synthesis FlgM
VVKENPMMKISALEAQSLPATAKPAERKPMPASLPPVDAAAEPSAKVALSPTAANMRAPATDGSFDTAKVERISQAIRDGKFQVNAEAIADKLIANAAELLARRPN